MRWNPQGWRQKHVSYLPFHKGSVESCLLRSEHIFNDTMTAERGTGVTWSNRCTELEYGWDSLWKQTMRQVQVKTLSMEATDVLWQFWVMKHMMGYDSHWVPDLVGFATFVMAGHYTRRIVLVCVTTWMTCRGRRDTAGNYTRCKASAVFPVYILSFTDQAMKLSILQIFHARLEQLVDINIHTIFWWVLNPKRGNVPKWLISISTTRDQRLPLRYVMWDNTLLQS